MRHYYGTAEVCDYSEELIDDSQRQLDLSLKQRGITFEGKSLPVQVKPYIYSETLSEHCRELFEGFFLILKKTEQLYRANEKVRAYFNLEPSLHELVSIENPTIHFNQLCRFDFMFDRNGIPQIYETNTACPGGLLLTPIVAELAAKTPLFKYLFSEKKYSWFSHQTNDYFAEVVSQTFYESRGVLPKVGLLNSRYNTLTNEMTLMAESLNRFGIPNEVCFVEDLHYSDEGVYSPNQKLLLDICFQKFDNALSEEKVAHFGATRASVSRYIDAIRGNRIAAINPFSSHYLSEQKSILSFLHDDEMQDLFEPAEQNLIKQIVPYTELATKFNEKKKYDKNDWVLKKSLDTRGRNVIIGSEVDQAEWLQSLHMSGAQMEGFVLQKKVKSEIVKDKSSTLYVSHAAFLVRGRYVGMFPRFSTEPLTNVGRNGFLGIPILGRN